MKILKSSIILVIASIVSITASAHSNSFEIDAGVSALRSSIRNHKKVNQYDYAVSVSDKYQLDNNFSVTAAVDLSRPFGQSFDQVEYNGGTVKNQFIENWIINPSIKLQIDLDSGVFGFAKAIYSKGYDLNQVTENKYNQKTTRRLSTNSHDLSYKTGLGYKFDIGSYNDFLIKVTYEITKQYVINDPVVTFDYALNFNDHSALEFAVNSEVENRRDLNFSLSYDYVF